MAIPNVLLAINNIIEGDYGVAAFQIVCAEAIILMGVAVILLWAMDR